MKKGKSWKMGINDDI